jgi:hypothetical protein
LDCRPGLIPGDEKGVYYPGQNGKYGNADRGVFSQFHLDQRTEENLFLIFLRQARPGNPEEGQRIVKLLYSSRINPEMKFKFCIWEGNGFVEKSSGIVIQTHLNVF